MEEPDLISHIEDLGLSNKEARVYIACLSLGSSPVQRIADQAGIKRVTAYVILESLASLGLVSQSIWGKKTVFAAESPANLKRFLDKREKELAEQKQGFIRILPQLEGLKSSPKDSPNAKVYDTIDGIRTIMNIFLEQGRRPGAGAAYGISNLDQLYEYFPEFESANANPQRAEAGIRSRFIYTSVKGPVLKDTDEQRIRESRWLPHDKFPVSGDFTVIGNDIMMLSLNPANRIGITISSKELADGLRAIFEVAWEAAAVYNQ